MAAAILATTIALTAPGAQTLASAASPTVSCLAGTTGAFQANTGILWTIPQGCGSPVSTGLAMRTSSSPSIKVGDSGTDIAFQANTGVLWTLSSSGVTRSTGLNMKHGTSPRGTAAAGDAIAFHGYDGTLWTYRNGIGSSTGLRMKPATSPDIMADPVGGFWIAFQADTSELWIVSPAGVATPTGRLMRAGSSPVLAIDQDSGLASLAFQSDTSHLCMINLSAQGFCTGLKMAPGTNPATVVLTGPNPWNKRFGVVFQLDTGLLWNGSITPGGFVSGSSTGRRMKAGTSPSQTVGSFGISVIAYQADNGEPVVIDSDGAAIPLGVTMMANTSPSISGDPQI